MIFFVFLLCVLNSAYHLRIYYFFPFFFTYTTFSLSFSLIVELLRLSNRTRLFFCFHRTLSCFFNSRFFPSLLLFALYHTLTLAYTYRLIAALHSTSNPRSRFFFHFDCLKVQRVFFIFSVY